MVSTIIISTIVLLILVFYINYRPKIDIVVMGKKAYNIYLWYTRYTEWGKERVYKLIYSNRKK